MIPRALITSGVDTRWPTPMFNHNLGHSPVSDPEVEGRLESIERELLDILKKDKVMENGKTPDFYNPFLMPSFSYGSIINQELDSLFHPHITQGSDSMEGVFSFDHEENLRVSHPFLLEALHWQSQLAMWYTPGLSEHIGLVFDKFKDLCRFKVAKNDTESYNSQQLIVALEKIRTDLVMGFLGALRIVHSKHEGLVSRNLIMKDGWNFLKSHLDEQLEKLKDKVIIVQPKLIYRPTYKNADSIDILSYTLKLPDKTHISSILIIYLLNTWYQTTEHWGVLPRISLTYGSFIQTCDKSFIFQGEGKSIWIPRKRITSTPNQLKNQDKNLEEGQNGEIESNHELRPPKRSIFLQQVQLIGRGIVKIKERDSSDKIQLFFKEFSKQIKSLSANQILAEEISENDHDLKIHSVNALIDKLVLKAQRYITTPFFGILFLMQEHTINDQTSKKIYEKGWEHLKIYFQQWLTYFTENKDTTIWSCLTDTSVDTTHQDWANVKQTIAYLNNINRGRHLSPWLLWYLTDTWYETITSKAGSENQEILKFITPPDRLDLKKKALIFHPSLKLFPDFWS
ncbi:hypothetical protein DFH28DRAFT_1025530 [Melampsora americana]|nr:hypothetical protein DFH28DRAFT_1025530 [Melampsora americana]